MGIYDVNGNLLTDSVTIRSYYSAEMTDTIAKVRALQTEPNLTFFYVTDIHAYYVSGHEELYKTSIENMRYLLTQIPCDGVVNLGDSIEGYSADTTAMNYGNLISNEFRKIGIPYYSVIGNHDDNRYHYSTTDDRLTVGERYQVFVNPTRKVVYDSTGLNYYVDFDEFNIRMICLNAVSDYAYKFATETCTWFSNVALDTDYAVLVNTHVAPVGAWNYNNTTPTNSSTIISALDTFSASKDVLAMVFGHNHVDAKFTSPYNGMTLCCEKFENENGDPSKWPSGATKPSRTAGTASEDCWTVMVVRPNSGKINFVRFGAGADYEITL